MESPFPSSFFFFFSPPEQVLLFPIFFFLYFWNLETLQPFNFLAEAQFSRYKAGIRIPSFTSLLHLEDDEQLPPFLFLSSSGLPFRGLLLFLPFFPPSSRPRGMFPRSRRKSERRVMLVCLSLLARRAFSPLPPFRRHRVLEGPPFPLQPDWGQTSFAVSGPVRAPNRTLADFFFKRFQVEDGTLIFSSLFLRPRGASFFPFPPSTRWSRKN